GRGLCTACFPQEEVVHLVSEPAGRSIAVLGQVERTTEQRGTLGLQPLLDLGDGPLGGAHGSTRRNCPGTSAVNLARAIWLDASVRASLSACSQPMANSIWRASSSPTRKSVT